MRGDQSTPRAAASREPALSRHPGGAPPSRPKCPNAPRGTLQYSTHLQFCEASEYDFCHRLSRGRNVNGTVSCGAPCSQSRARNETKPRSVAEPVGQDDCVLGKVGQPGEGEEFTLSIRRKTHRPFHLCACNLPFFRRRFLSPCTSQFSDFDARRVLGTLSKNAAPRRGSTEGSMEIVRRQHARAQSLRHEDATDAL